MVHKVFRRVCSQPIFPFISQFFIECKFNHLIVLLVQVLKVNLMRDYLSEVLLGLLRRGCSQPFVVFDLPYLQVFIYCPDIKFVLCEERHYVSAARCLEQGCHELIHETIHLKKWWPEKVDEVDDQSFDVRAIGVLISHYHNFTVSQTLGVFILLANLNA